MANHTTRQKTTARHPGFTANDVIRACGGGHIRPGFCFCPVHNDRNTPNLSVTDKNGTVIVYCTAGCDQDEVWNKVKAITKPSGNAQPKTRPDKAEQEDYFTSTAWKAMLLLRCAAKSKEQPTAYLKGRGITIVPPCAMLIEPNDAARLTGKRFPTMVVPIINAERMQGCQITWLNKDADTKLAVSKGEARRSYGDVTGGYIQLCELDPDVPLDRPLIVGEGVESVLSAMQISGLPGIAIMGAYNFKNVVPPSCSEVIIAADNDKSGVGLKAAAPLVERLKFEGRKVRVALPVMPVDHGGKKYDWNDVLRYASDPMSDWVAALDKQPAPSDAEPFSNTETLQAIDEEEFMKLAFPKRELFLEPWLPRAGLVMIVAPRGEGKTYFALSVAKHIAAKKDFLGWLCPRYARVLYVDGELPGASLQERLGRFEPSPPGTFHILCRDSYLLRRQIMPDLGTPEGRQELDRIIAQCKPDVIILDSLSTLVRTGIENEAESWGPIQNWLMTHRWNGKTIIQIHHTGRSGDPRGTSKREDVLDTIIRLRKLDEEDTEKDESAFELSFTKYRDFFGDDAAPLNLYLSMSGGALKWRFERKRNVQIEKVRQMLAGGMKQKDIAKELGYTAARISQLVRDAKRGDKENVVPFAARKQPLES